MGGSKGSPFGMTAVERLEEMARQRFEAASGPERRNVFISFVHEDLDEVERMREHAADDRYALEFRDHSVKEPFDSENAEYIRRRIAEKIRMASVTLVYVSELTASSRWVDWEIRESIRQGKGVIAVYRGDAPPARLPSAVIEHSVRVMPLKNQRVTDAIERAAVTRTPSGPKKE